MRSATGRPFRDRCINEIAHKLKGLYKREATRGGGPEPYAPLAMFKLMLGQWHSPSDTQLEHALKVRLDLRVPMKSSTN